MEVDQAGAWVRIGARLYDPLLAVGERAGMRKRRAALLAGARGRVLEIGAGTGLNLSHYPVAVEELVLTEPAGPMARRLERRVRALDRRVQVVPAAAEELPFADDSFDTAVSTLVLCTVQDPERSIAELIRVLRPGGTLLAIEHGPSSSPRWAAVQRMLEPPWKVFACGCHVTRRITEQLSAAGFRIKDLRAEKWRGMIPIVKPLSVLRATAPSRIMSTNPSGQAGPWSARGSGNPVE